ncbi:hypothetical protein ACLB2K_002198 [Fragaria x ananassa]
MEKQDHLMKMEGNTRSSSFHETTADYSYPFSGMFDFSQGDQKDSLGFMELLGIQDYFCPANSLFDLPQISVPPPQVLLPTTSITDVAKEYSVNPSTPNSSSISSASSEAVNEEPLTDNKAAALQQEEDDDGDQPVPKKGSKANQKRKKTTEKKPRQPRFAFMTKSEVDHLEDGYRWRKYGQKAVKNSPFPRSYFRCTSASCNVKKRVERCINDPSIVVTTYEGQHTHLSPLMSPPPPPATALSSILMPRTLFSHYQQQQGLQPFEGNQTSNSCFATPNRNFLNERRFCSPAGGSALMTDHGLLQDIVPSSMLKQVDR